MSRFRMDVYSLLSVKICLYEWIWICRYEYRWADGVQIKKPIEVSAPKYVEYLMEWIEVQLDDESIFPQKLGRACWCKWILIFLSIMTTKLSWAWLLLIHVISLLQAHLFLQTSKKLWRQYSSACSAFMPTYTTHIFRRLSALRKKHILTLASSISLFLHM